VGASWSKCSFDALVERYKSRSLAVLEFTKIVRAADTDKPHVPQAGELDAVMTGIFLVAKDDYEAIEKVGLVYEAFYSFCRLKLLHEIDLQLLHSCQAPVTVIENQGSSDDEIYDEG
jgi:hypothetical protein